MTSEIKKLKAENRRLKEDIEILKAATVFFAGELDPRNRPLEPIVLVGFGP